ncbi:MAG: DNA polymerase I [Bacteroidales bacterium]|nr:DNA polymerase I [Bacteroidales bacterium]
MKKLLLIDGMAAVYRAYYALNRNPRVNSKGLNTSAVLGFTTTLYDLLRSQKPTHVGVAFDLPKPTFRHEMYAEYKANRDAMPEEIQLGLPWVRRIIEAFRIPILTCEGYEADDVIGTLSHAAEREGFDEVLMVTPDKDFAQLVTEHVHMYRFGRMGKPDSLMGIAEVKEKFDVSDCRQVIDLLGLWGDTSDNIPGIPGVGEKTAKKLIAQFGSIERMVENAEEINNPKIRGLVQQYAEQALFSKKLATIMLDAPIPFDEQQLRLEQPDYQQLKEVTDYLEFRQFAKKVFTDLSLKDPSQAVAWGNQGTPKAPTVQSTPSAPTLFDLSAPATEAPQVEHKPLTAEVLRQLQGKDIALWVDGPRMVLSTDADSVWLSLVSELDVELFTQLMEDASTLKICFDLKNIEYILAELLPAHHNALPTDTFFDVQLAHYLIDAEVRHTMDFICSAIIGYEPQDAPACAAALWQLYPLLVASLHDAQLEELYHKVELPLVEVLMDMEREGVRIDVDALKQYSQQLGEQRTAIEEKIFELAGERFNIASPKQLGEVLYEKLKVTDKPPRTATKQYSTAEDVLVKLAQSPKLSAPHASLITNILDYRSITKLMGTYLDSFPKLINPTTHRLHTVYNQTVTATGRLSSSNPNLQNIPIRTERGREIRRAFVPRDDEHLLLAADYSQIELRIIASLAHDRHMLEAFANGYDIHAATAAKIYKKSIDEVSKDERRNAKSVNFGIVYGISAFGLSEQLGIARKEAAALIDEYFAQYPDIRRFIDSSVEFARQHGYAQTLLGRRRYLPDINSRNAAARSFAERNAVNMPIQGTSADMIKLAMVQIHSQLRCNNLRTKMILQVHDELVFDLYRPEEEQVRRIVEQAMKTALPLEGIEIDVGMGVGENWLEAH